MPSLLIIDDAPDDRAACYRGLKSEGNLFRTLEAGDGIGGLTMIDAHHPAWTCCGAFRPPTAFCR